MMLRWTLVIFGWLSIAYGVGLSALTVHSALDSAAFAQGLGWIIAWNALLGGLPGFVWGVGFGAALLRLASLDRGDFARQAKATN